MDRFEEMQTFVRVVEAGSFSGAAQRLDIARSAVSRRLADLEGRLGVQLLNRTTRSLNLTDSGRHYYRRCQRLLADLEEAEQTVSSEHAAVRGTIRVAAPLSFSVSHLAPALEPFMKAYPEIQLELELDDRRVDVIAEGVDMAIRIGKLADSTLVARRLMPVRTLLCASPAYLAQHGEPQRPEELARHQGLSYSNIPEGQLWQFQQPDGSWMTVRVPTRLRANNGDLLVRAAIDGLGIVATPDFLCQQAMEKGLLRPVLTTFPLHEAAVYALYPAQRHLPRRVRLFLDYLVESFAGSPHWK